MAPHRGPALAFRLYDAMDLFQEAQPRTALALPPRTVLNDVYEVGRVLGKGGFGITYAALDRHLQVPVAIKEYLPAQVAGRATDRSTVEPHGGNEQEVFEHGLNAFLEEARTLAQFDHPNIVQVRAFFEQYGTGYLVMPYYEGRTLDAVVGEHDGPMPVGEALAMMDPVFDGLEAVHGANLLHRDIKPQNVYLTSDGRTILLDFGAARIAFGQESQSLSAVLTPGYAPFEQYSRRGHQGPWTDVYATAATLYRLVTGEKPPEATDRMAGEPLKPVYTLNAAVPPAFSEAVATGLALKPSDRPQTIAGFRSILQQAIGAETVLVTEPAGAATVIDDQGTVVDGQRTVVDASGPGASTPPPVPSAPSGTGILVLQAEAPVRYRLDDGAAARLGRGETVEVRVPAGPHAVKAAFGPVRIDRQVTVEAGSRTVLALAPPRGRSRAADRGERTRSGPGLGMIVGGGVVLLLVFVLAVVAIGNAGGTDDSPPDSRSFAGVIGSETGEDLGLSDKVDMKAGAQTANPSLQPIVFQDLGVPFVRTGALQVGDETIQSGEFTDVYTFETGPANLFFIEAYSEEIDPYLILVGPNGQTVAENDDLDGDVDVSYIEYHVVQPGTHRLFVTSAFVGEVGPYSLTVTPDFVP